MYQTILVPTDGSDGADRAVEHALGLAEAHEATVHAVYVVEPIYTAEYSGEEIVAAMRSEGEAATAAIAEAGERRGVPVETEIRRGAPHREILASADDNDADLLVMATHGRTGLDRYLLGSVTEKVVRMADVPVLTVPIQSEADEE